MHTSSFKLSDFFTHYLFQVRMPSLGTNTVLSPFFSSKIYPILYVIIYSYSRSRFWFTLSKYLVYLSHSLVKVLFPTQVHLFIQYLVHLPLSTQIPVLLPFLVHLSTQYLVHVPFLFQVSFCYLAHVPVHSLVHVSLHTYTQFSMYPSTILITNLSALNNVPLHFPVPSTLVYELLHSRSHTTSLSVK